MLEFNTVCVVHVIAHVYYAQPHRTRQNEFFSFQLHFISFTPPWISRMLNRRPDSQPTNQSTNVNVVPIDLFHFHCYYSCSLSLQIRLLRRLFVCRFERCCNIPKERTHSNKKTRLLLSFGLFVIAIDASMRNQRKKNVRLKRNGYSGEYISIDFGFRQFSNLKLFAKINILFFDSKGCRLDKNKFCNYYSDNDCKIK